MQDTEAPEVLEAPMVPMDRSSDVALLTLGSGRALQQAGNRYATAMTVQKPRSLVLVDKALKAEADLAGELFYYGWGSGKDRLEGATVKLANAVARLYGNCVVDMLPVQDLMDSWIFTAVFVDLETGFTLSRQFRQSKAWKVYGKHDEARKEDIRFQIGQSKAVRNVILNAIPVGLIDHAMEQAKSGVRKKIEEYVGKNGLPAAVDVTLKALEKVGVKNDFVLAKLERPTIQAITVEDIVELKGDLSAIHKGEERADVLFPDPSKTEAGGRTAGILDKAGVGKPETKQEAKPEEKKPEEKKPEQDLDEADRSAAVAAFRKRIPRCDNSLDLDELETDLMRSGFAEEEMVALGKEVTAQRESIKPKAPEQPAIAGQVPHNAGVRKRF